MKAVNKVFIILVAAIALVLGWLLNSARLSNEFDSDVFLQAELLQKTGADNGESVKIRDQLGALNLVNFWASWCSPCRTEMPVFEAMYRQHKSTGFQIIGVAIDRPAKAIPMLDSMDITYPILYAEQTGMQLMSALGNPDGYLPYTLLLDKNGKVLAQKLGVIHEQEITQWLKEYR